MVCCICVIAFLVAAYYIVRYFIELLPIKNLNDRVVFITGCDSGFGMRLALKCASHGMIVFAGCLTKEGEELLKEESDAISGNMIRTLHVDVTNQETIDNALHYISVQLLYGLQLWAVVNNAGFLACHGPEDWTSIEDYQRALDVNTLGVIRVVHSFRPLLRKSKGRFITTTSIGGRMVLAGASPYFVSKYATEAFMDALRRDMRPFGIDCLIVEPGVFRTKFIDAATVRTRLTDTWARLPDEKKSVYGEEYKEKYVQTFPEEMERGGSSRLDYVVDSYFHAITARYPRSRYLCGWDAIFYVALSHLPTFVSDFVMERLAGTVLVPAYVKHPTD